MSDNSNSDLSKVINEDTVDGIINYKVKLQDLAAKNRFEVKYDDPMILNEDDDYPLFNVTCRVKINGEEVIETASRRNKNTAQQIASKKVIEKLERNEETESIELTKFYSQLAINEEVFACLKTDTNDVKKLDNVLSLMGCIAEYNLSNDAKKILLRIAVRGERNNTVVMNLVEIITENNDADSSKDQLARKAINILKMFV